MSSIPQLTWFYFSLGSAIFNCTNLYLVELRFYVAHQLCNFPGADSHLVQAFRDDGHFLVKFKFGVLDFEVPKVIVRIIRDKNGSAYFLCLANLIKLSLNLPNQYLFNLMLRPANLPSLTLILYAAW